VPFIIGLVLNVVLGLVSNWLYEKLRSRSSKLRIDHTDVTIDRDKVSVVIEHIETDGR